MSPNTITHNHPPAESVRESVEAGIARLTEPRAGSAKDRIRNLADALDMGADANSHEELRALCHKVAERLRIVSRRY